MVIYFLVRWALILGDRGLIRYYLTDLLFVPAMCTFGLIGVRLIKKSKDLTISWIHVLIQVVFVSWYFEWYLPSNYEVYTSDIWDVVMYFTGGALFLLIQKWL